MDLAFSEEQQDYRRAIRDFVARELPRAYVRDCDHEGRAPLEAYRKLGETGWLATGVPDEYGGVGSFVDVAILLEELARGSYALASMVGRTVAYATPLLIERGTPEQQAAYIPALTAGQFLLSVAMTEPETGSDAAGISTRGRVLDDEIVIDGRKIYSSGAGIADRLLVSVRTNPNEPRQAGLSTILVDPSLAGVTLTPIEFMGNRANPVFEITFEEVRVPRSELIGELHGGWGVLSAHLERERINMAAKCTGAMQAAMDEATGWANQREQFGKPLSRLQAVRHFLADMATDVYLTRLATYHAAALYASGAPCRMEAFMTKVFATEAYQRVADRGMQIMGALGYSTSADMERHFRDSRSGRIGGGSSEVLRNAIGSMASAHRWEDPWW